MKSKVTWYENVILGLLVLLFLGTLYAASGWGYDSFVTGIDANGFELTYWTPEPVAYFGVVAAWSKTFKICDAGGKLVFPTIGFDGYHNQVEVTFELDTSRCVLSPVTPDRG